MNSRTPSANRTRPTRALLWSAVTASSAAASAASSRLERLPVPDQVVEDATDDDLGCDLLRLSLVGDDEPVAHDIEGDRLDVIRQNVVATVEERVRARCERDVDRRPRRDTVRDERLQIGELRPLRIAGREDHTD